MTTGVGVVWGVVICFLCFGASVDTPCVDCCLTVGRFSMLKKFLKGSKSVGKGLLLEYTVCVLVCEVPCRGVGE